MPIYEYSCDACGEDFEKLILKLSEESDIVCPKCNSDLLSKIMSKNTFKLKGAGWTLPSNNGMSDEDIIKNGPAASIENMKKLI